MNVYVRELVSSLAQAGVRSTVFTRRGDDDVPADRIQLVPPGVIHAFFSPGDRRGAQRALGLQHDGRPVLLFVGRIQPLKGVDVAISALAELEHADAELLVVGGPSGPDGDN